MTPFIVLLITAKDKEQAEKIGRKLLAERLAACVNMIEGVKSLFWWQGQVDQAEEILLIVKSRSGLFPEIVSCVKSQHSYDVPEILALPVVQGNDDYLKWVAASMKERQGINS